jgi:hypothetical protein
MQLHTIWLVIVAILRVGFLVLEGFDLGVGMMHIIVGRTETERRVALNTIGPWVRDTITYAGLRSRDDVVGAGASRSGHENESRGPLF